MKINETPQGMKEYTIAHQRKRKWLRVVTCLAAVVVFCTTYALILPAITLDKGYTLDCSYTIHQHDETCYDEDGKLICGYADYVVHTHQKDYCYDESGNLVCGLNMVEPHKHDASCYQEQSVLACKETESDGHEHSADCYTRVQGELTCEQSEGEGHVHDDSCYTKERGELECQEEHEHTDDCYAWTEELTCGKAEGEGAHTHTDDCYVWTEELTCGKETGEGAHQHSGDCYQTESVLTCEKDEVILHTHSADCYDADGNLTCGLLQVEEHQHDEACESASIAEQADSAVTSVEPPVTSDEPPVTSDEPPSYVYEITLKDGSKVTMTRMMEYADATEGSNVTITISDRDNKVIQPDDNNNYEVIAGEPYNVKFLYTGNILEEGKYYITFTADIDNFNQGGSLNFTGNNGEQVDLGSWYFVETEDGRVLLVFDITANMTNYSNITLSADVACTFSYENSDLDFDGGIHITIKPGENTGNTEVNKWADGLVENNTKIRWGSELYGYSNSHIVGGTITDTLTTTDTHYYTQTDMDNGITFYARQYQPGAEVGGKEGVIAEHRWKAASSDENLTWTETGWSYQMPQTVVCLDCGQTVSLGDSQWYYYFSYTSTVKNPDSEGYTVYENKIAADGDEDTATETTGLEHPTGKVVKNGHYNHVDLTEEELEANNKNPYAKDTFEWDITGTIPAAVAGEKYICTWRFYDGMTVGKSNQSYDPQDLTVTAQIGGQTYTVYEYGDSRATESPICYRNSYTDSASGGREFDFYCKCTCTADTCGLWVDGNCGTGHSNGWCECWNISEDTTITFQYSTEAGELTEINGGQTLVNNVELGYTLYPGGTKKSKKNFAADRDDADVKIPGLFTKIRTEAPTEDNGLLAEYAITVNEGMADLKSAHQGITIVDKMSKTLNFVASTLRITCTDAQGNERTLTNGTDYTVNYNTGNAANNILTIVLKEDVLGPYQYALIYDASVRGTSENQTSYQNTAEVSLFGQTRNVDSGELSLPSAAASAVTYNAMLIKQDSKDETKKLAGAEFALYQAVEDGEDIFMEKYTTDENGKAEIQTDTSKSVIFNPHVLYYLVETKAPTGYQLDKSKHYFWFCDNDEQISCSRDVWGLPPINGQCIYSIHRSENADWNHIVVGNEPIPKDHELPQTGGSGTIPYTIGGLLIIGAGLLLLYKKRRKEDFASS